MAIRHSSLMSLILSSIYLFLIYCWNCFLLVPRLCVFIYLPLNIFKNI